MYVKGHHITFCVDFDESRNNSFFTGVQKRILTIQAMESNYKKYASV